MPAERAEPKPLERAEPKPAERAEPKPAERAEPKPAERKGDQRAYGLCSSRAGANCRAAFLSVSITARAPAMGAGRPSR